ncbi:MAG: DUF2950 family protein [Planctomycetes bacterium]|nr:DUF2950 family protein [Planctomycetota bacterium]
MTRRPRNAGFTFTELLILLGILVVLGSIAATSLSHARLASNESVAVAALRNVAVTETAWRQTDADGNGQPDFWTQDWSGFFRVADAKGQPLGLISEDLARADGAPADATNGEGRPRVTASLVTGAAVPHAGYFFRAMTLDNQSPDAKPYATDGPDADSDARENSAHFGFTAWPASPGSSGSHVLILLETGSIWARDLDGPGPGGPAPAGCTLMPNAKGGQLSWPGQAGNPDLKKTPSGAWRSVQ